MRVVQVLVEVLVVYVVVERGGVLVVGVGRGEVLVDPAVSCVAS